MGVVVSVVSEPFVSLELFRRRGLRGSMGSAIDPIGCSFWLPAGLGAGETATVR